MRCTQSTGTVGFAHVATSLRINFLHLYICIMTCFTTYVMYKVLQTVITSLTNLSQQKLSYSPTSIKFHIYVVYISVSLKMRNASAKISTLHLLVAAIVFLLSVVYFLFYSIIVCLHCRTCILLFTASFSFVVLL